MKRILAVVLILVVLVTFAGCGNMDITEGMTSSSNTLRYILVQEAGQWHLHTIDKWMDSSSDAVGVITSCCHNRFWTSYNNAILYQEFPTYLPENVIICEKSN